MWGVSEFAENFQLRISSVALACAILAGLAGYPQLAGGAGKGNIVVLDDFEDYGSSTYPKKWRSDPDASYRVESELGNHFLQARAGGGTIQIGLEYVFNPKKLRQLHWRWRVRAFPMQGVEQSAGRHDAVSQVYVMFDSPYLPRVIKFVWSAELPAGSRLANPVYDRGRIVVLKSRAQKETIWEDEKVNFYDEYRKFFGNEPGQVQGIGILTGAQSSKSTVVVDYDDFVLLP